LTKRKPSKKEIESVISGLINHVRHLEEKLNALDSLFGLYLEWKKDKNTFNKFVDVKLKKYQAENNSENEPGETK
tara:strand:+ start:275 stop:499 length:225 start_codon:yes stop_codon:yes gene_type:complete